MREYIAATRMIADDDGPQPQVDKGGQTIHAPVSRYRWWVLLLLFIITVINFIDRQTLSVLAPVIRETFQLNNTQYGRIVSALQFGLMSGEFPMGWLMDRWGVRIGLSLAVFWWSAATGSQIFSKTAVQLGLSRYWMGTGECGNYSGGIKAVTSLFPVKERTLAIGIFNGGSMVGATIAPPLIVFLLVHYGFRAAFLVPAVFGLVWIPFWWVLYQRSQPARQEIEASTRQSPFSLLIRRRSTWGVMLTRFFVGPVAQFYWYWVPSYLATVWHLSLKQIGLLAWIPFVLGDAGGILGGLVAGWLQARNISTYNVRRITMFASALLCFTAFCVPFMRTVTFAILAIGVAILADNFLSSNMYGAITDLFEAKDVGRVTGLTGVAGGFSGLLFPLLTGWLIDRSSYTMVFFIIAFMPLAGVILLFFLAREYRTKPSLNAPVKG